MITMMLHYSKPPLTSAKLLSREKSKQEEQWLEDVTAPLVALGVGHNMARYAPLQIFS
jgi:hypothetical protein